MEKTRQTLIGKLRNRIVACNLAIKREGEGKLDARFVNEFLRERIMEAEEILKELYEKGKL